MKAKKPRQPRFNIYLRGEVWWMHFTPVKGGKQKHLSLKIKKENYNEALKKAKQIKGRPSTAGIGTWKTDLDTYLAEQRRDRKFTKATERGTRHCAERFFKAVGKDICQELELSDSQKFFDALKGPDTTRQTYLGRMRGFVRWLKDNNKIDADFLRGVKGVFRPQPHAVARDQYLYPHEIAQLMLFCTDLDLKFILMSGFYAGMRKKEIVMARCHWFHFDAGNIYIPYYEATDGLIFETKNKKPRVVPLIQQFEDFLCKEYPFSESQKWALRAGTGTEWYRYDFRDKFNTLIKNAKKAGIIGVGQHITAHSMRHSFCTANLSAGKPLSVVAAWAGNTTRVLEQHYWHAVPQRGAMEGVF